VCVCACAGETQIQYTTIHSHTQEIVFCASAHLDNAHGAGVCVGKRQRQTENVIACVREKERESFASGGVVRAVARGWGVGVACACVRVATLLSL